MRYEDRETYELEQFIDRLMEIGGQHDPVEIGTVVEATGRRSFAPLLLVAGLIALSPLSGIPGVPTLVAVLVVLIAVQFLLGRDHFWLPGWLMRRRIGRAKFCKALRFLRRPARFIDPLVRPRLAIMTHDAGVHTIAVVCILIAATMPALEIFPFVASAAGAALTAFGLALIAEDGLLGLIAWIFTVVAGGFALTVVVGG